MSDRTESIICEQVNKPMSSSVTIGRMSGIVKRFNNKSGFGFITVVSDNEHKGVDIFVHYSAIRLKNNQYKFLIQGEYVDFDLTMSTTDLHKFNASDVWGINGGPIMCETRKNAFEQSSTQAPQQQTERKYTVRSSQPQQSTVRSSQPQQSTDDGFKQVKRNTRQHTTSDAGVNRPDSRNSGYSERKPSLARQSSLARPPSESRQSSSV